MSNHKALRSRLLVVAIATSAIGVVTACEPATTTTTTKPPTTTTTKPPAPPASTPAHVAHSKQVSALPASNTPHALNNDVKTVLEIGSTVYMGGSYTAAAQPDKTPADRKYLLAFDKATGKISTKFNPVLDGMVFSIVAAPDGKSLYLGGQFSNINGERHAKIARIDAATGKPMKFEVFPDSAVTTMAMVKGKLWVGGVFKKISGKTQRVAAIDPISGVVDNQFKPNIEGGWGEGRIYRIEPRPDQKKVIVLGEFSAIDGSARIGVAKYNISSDGTATLNPFSTNWCEYGKDISYSPDGSYFVVVGNGGACKAVHRFNDADEGPGLVVPVWTTNSSGDSFYAVESTGPVIYVGGHFRGLNGGVIPREGIAALEAANGLPTSWNPGRDRGRGVWEIKATPNGLYVSSDTDRIGRYYYHGRFAYFPLAGGLPVVTPTPIGSTPFTMNQYVPAVGAGPAAVISRTFDGLSISKPAFSTMPAAQLVGVRNSFMVGNKLVIARSSGAVDVYTFDGKTYSGPVAVDPAMYHFWGERGSATNEFYLGGQVYSSIGGTLYRRGFSAEQFSVHEQQFIVQASFASVDYAQMVSMFPVGQYLYWVDFATKELRRGKFNPISGVDSATVKTILKSVPQSSQTFLNPPGTWAVGGKVA